MSDVGIRFGSYSLSDEMTSDDGFNLRSLNEEPRAHFV